jgi:hypothetical protein
VLKARVAVGAVWVHEISELPGSNVKFVVTVASQVLPGPVRKYVPLPSLMFRTPVPVIENAVVADTVTFLLLTLLSNVPVNAPIVTD